VSNYGRAGCSRACERPGLNESISGALRAGIWSAGTDGRRRRRLRQPSVVVVGEVVGRVVVVALSPGVVVPGVPGMVVVGGALDTVSGVVNSGHGGAPVVLIAVLAVNNAVANDEPLQCTQSSFGPMPTSRSPHAPHAPRFENAEVFPEPSTDMTE
jgi:hypothetical protein